MSRHRTVGRTHHRRHAPSTGQRALGYHLTFRLADDRPIATTAAQRRVLAGIVLVQGASRGLLSFGAADNHLHAHLAGAREEVGAFARYVEVQLRWHLRLPVPFEPVRIGEIRDQAHATNTFFYALEQDVHHGIGQDLARDATSGPELMGLRALEPSLFDRVRERLPRVRRARVEALFPEGILEPSTGLAAELLADAAAAALALPDLQGRSLAVVRARRAAIQLVADRLTTKTLSDCLGITCRAVQLLRVQARDPRLMKAIERQLRLRALLAARRPGSGG